MQRVDVPTSAGRSSGRGEPLEGQRPASLARPRAPRRRCARVEARRGRLADHGRVVHPYDPTCARRDARRLSTWNNRTHEPAHRAESAPLARHDGRRVRHRARDRRARPRRPWGCWTTRSSSAPPACSGAACRGLRPCDLPLAVLANTPRIARPARPACSPCASRPDLPTGPGRSAGSAWSMRAPARRLRAASSRPWRGCGRASGRAIVTAPIHKESFVGGGRRPGRDTPRCCRSWRAEPGSASAAGAHDAGQRRNCAWCS